MKVRILKNALAHGRRFVEGEAVEVSEATGTALMSAGLAVQTGGDGAETQTDGEGEPTAGAAETAADKPKRGRGRNRGGANK